MIETEKSPKRKAKDRDGVYKRRGHWHFDYKDPQTGQWRSKTTGKTNYNDAKEFKRDFLKSLNGQYNPSNDRLKFAEAADAYMGHRGVAASAGTVRLEKERLRALKKLLAQIAPIDLKLKDFEDIRLIRTYQQKRIGERVGPRTVNMEGQLLRSILKHHEQWKLDGKYQPLPEPVSEAGRSLTPEEEVRLIDTAKSRPEWTVAYHGTILENETGMRGVEVRNLQMKRVDLMAAEIRLQKSKTKGGVRTIPLNADALESAKQLVIRAQKLGANQPDHYLIPALVKAVIEGNSGALVRVRRYDPANPTKSWRTAWRNLTEKAGLKGLRGHDLRHNWITSHAEIGTPQSVLEAQAGHLSKRMSDHYKHISEKAARRASDALSRVKAEQRAAVRAKTQEQARADTVLIDFDGMSIATDASTGQSAVVH
ncbi:MAG: tyrosine-type recombinase/integrase [Bryobacteraceae bacterium]|jgi:integrase